MKPRLLAVPALGAALCAAALTGCPARQPAEHVDGQVRVTLLHTSDIHSRLFPYDMQIAQTDAALGLGADATIVDVGGAARISHILGRERARAGRVAHIDGGDCFQGAPIFNFFSGEAEMRAMSAMGTDVMVIANHEFDRGALNVARQIQKWAAFPVLAANYQLQDPTIPGSAALASVLQPFEVLDLDGLRVLVLGMGNLSSITSIFDQPNSLGIVPLATREVAQFYIDLMRPSVDLVVLVTHLGLDVDQDMIANTSGIDVVLGGHNHIVLQPPKTVTDCANVDETGRHYIEIPSGAATDPSQPATYTRRYCTPRNVILAHSGAFAKYVGRLDLVVSNHAQDLDAGYDPLNGFEVMSHEYQLFPVTDQVPEDPVVVRELEPYRQGLDALIDLDLLVGYSPDGSKRSATTGGDAPLGNLVATAAWLRLGVQTDFSLTNTTGIRTDLVPGPVTIEEMFNVFPFDNSITKMQLSGVEVQQLFDFVAVRSTRRGCVSQAQIAGARVVLDCGGCKRPGADDPTSPCADGIYIGQTGQTCASDVECVKCVDGACPGAGGVACAKDADCAVYTPHVCNLSNPDVNGRGTCGRTIDPFATYELATSNYLAAGGSGYRVLQRNTTQLDTKIQQRDALTDYIRQGKPCGYSKTAGTDEGLTACTTDADCAGADADRVCACVGTATEDARTGVCSTSSTCDGKSGRCVLRGCRDDIAAFHRKRCATSGDAVQQAACKVALNACEIAGEECKFLSCVDRSVGNYSDDRILMEAQ